MNVNSYTGLRPVSNRDHDGFGGVVAYYLPASAATVTVGDIIVKKEGLNPSPIYGYGANELCVCEPLVAAAGANAVTGVIVGIAPVDPYVNVGDHGLTGKDRIVWVQDSPEAEFAVRANAGATIVVGQNADIVYAVPDAQFGQSRVSLASSATGQTLPFKVVRLLNEVGNVATEDFAEYVVRINNSTEAPLTAGV